MILQQPLSADQREQCASIVLRNCLDHKILPLSVSARSDQRKVKIAFVYGRPPEAYYRLDSLDIPRFNSYETGWTLYAPQSVTGYIGELTSEVGVSTILSHLYAAAESDPLAVHPLLANRAVEIYQWSVLEGPSTRLASGNLQRVLPMALAKASAKQVGAAAAATRALVFQKDVFAETLLRRRGELFEALRTLITKAVFTDGFATAIDLHPAQFPIPRWFGKEFPVTIEAIQGILEDRNRILQVVSTCAKHCNYPDLIDVHRFLAGTQRFCRQQADLTLDSIIKTPQFLDQWHPGCFRTAVFNVQSGTYSDICTLKKPTPATRALGHEFRL